MEGHEGLKGEKGERLSVTFDAISHARLLVQMGAFWTTNMLSVTNMLQFIGSSYLDAIRYSETILMWIVSQKLLEVQCRPMAVQD